MKHPSSGNHEHPADASESELQSATDSAQRAAIAGSALREALALPDPAARETALDSLAWQSLADDPATAQACLDGLTPGGPAACRLAAHLAMRVGEEDPAKGLAWAGSLDDPERTEAIAAIATLVAATSPAKALALLDDIQSGTAKDRALVAMAQRWVQHDAPAAAHWVATLPDGRAKTDAITQVAQLWGHADPDTAVAWMANLPATADRDHAAATIARDVVPHDEAAATTWLDHLKDPANREWIRRARSAISPNSPATPK